MAEVEEYIKIHELPTASSFSGVFPQAAAGTNRTEQVSSGLVASKLRETYDNVYAIQSDVAQSLLSKADADTVYTKTESDNNFKSKTAPHFMLYHSSNEIEAVGTSLYASPGDTIASQSIEGFDYTSGSLTCTKAGKYIVGAGVSHLSSSKDTLFNFYWAKNWTSGAPTGSDLASIQQRLTGTSAGFLECTWIFDLIVGDTLDLVVKADKSANITFLAGTKYYGWLA